MVGGVVVGVEQGPALRDQDDESIEQFGYADGRSQPLMLERDIKEHERRYRTFKHWNPAAGRTSR
jgi:hypothetical protein